MPQCRSFGLLVFRVLSAAAKHDRVLAPLVCQRPSRAVQAQCMISVRSRAGNSVPNHCQLMRFALSARATVSRHVSPQCSCSSFWRGRRARTAKRPARSWKEATMSWSSSSPLVSWPHALRHVPRDMKPGAAQGSNEEVRLAALLLIEAALTAKLHLTPRLRSSSSGCQNQFCGGISNRKYIAIKLPSYD